MCVSFGNIRGQLLGALGMVQADLAKTTQRQIRTRRRAERTERDFRCSIFLCHSAKSVLRSARAVVTFVSLSLPNPPTMC